MLPLNVLCQYGPSESGRIEGASVSFSGNTNAYKDCKTHIGHLNGRSGHVWLQKLAVFSQQAQPCLCAERVPPVEFTNGQGPDRLLIRLTESQREQMTSPDQTRIEIGRSIPTTMYLN